MIPPSVPFIFYGLLAKESIGALFLVGIIPGLMLASFYIIYIGIRCKLQPHMGTATPAEERFSVQEKLKAVFGIWPFILLLFIVLGVIWFGLATPQEAAAFGAGGALIINICYRRLTKDILVKSLESTVQLTAMGFWILIGANLFTNVFSALGCQDVITGLALSMPGGTFGVIIMMMLIIMVLGMIMDDWAIIMLCTPLFVPILRALEVDLLWFGVLFIVNIQIAYLTPPFGFVLFWLKSVLPKDVGIGVVYRSVLPFIGLQLLGLILIIIFPEIATWLPNMVFGK